MDVKRRNVIIIIVSLFVLFVSVYYITSIKLRNNEVDSSKRQVKQEDIKEDSLAVGSTGNEVLDKDSKIIFKIKYKKSGDTVTVRETKVLDNVELVGKGKEEIEKIYSKEGYKVEEFKDHILSLVKEEDKYMPNKYVVGIKGDNIAIYRTDKSGNMYIEDENKDITDIKTNKLKEQDIHMLTTGDKYFQCDTREEAEARLEDYE
ncbi:hypothetical protein JQ038_19635 [Clostridium botulinum]|uniref:Bypass of forespore C C-terminal domain-containing protein n=1 Tax=Clostridium botulinum TaxID=1491 RepID=A0A6G4EGE1_CLOBO|nr:hypothetical protein [Clostridium botulinum]APH20464.1 hypothetical protein NPD3_1703 [Clostridium botulinum]AUM92558.1 hypothetical protein RSJ5_15195 [Clostridium botulinum]KEI79814.1 hypothetical protein N452_14980 [Clostridium botulinum A2 117]MBN3416906.1 hypothetical protein [Clostridium botulinum]MBN3443397.1 hypothetical protein [Clostridium botulinum]